MMKKIKNFPLGISIAKTNCKETVDVNTAILDYYHSLGILEPFADYITINISCPNTFGGQPFSSPELLEQLLTKLDTITPDTIALDTVKPKKPRYIKLSPDLTKKEVDGIISICMKHKVQGFIISNLLKKRENSNIPLSAFNKVGMGGLSGKPVENYSNQLISYVYAKTKGKMTIIGCGGIFNSRDAYAKIKAGASLVQLITAMIYQGPGVINEINKGLVKLVKKDGFSNISEAVGVDHRLR